MGVVQVILWASADALSLVLSQPYGGRMNMVRTTIDERVRDIIRAEVRAAIHAELQPVLQALERLGEHAATQSSDEAVSGPHNAEPERWLKPAEAAARLRISAKTLANWRASGAGPRYRRIGRLIRYEREHLEAFTRGETA